MHPLQQIARERAWSTSMPTVRFSQRDPRLSRRPGTGGLDRRQNRGTAFIAKPGCRTERIRNNGFWQIQISMRKWAMK